MKTTIFLASLIIALHFSCTKPMIGCDAGPMQQMLKLHYFDSSGNELFADGKNGFLKDSVRVFDFKNGETTTSILASFFLVYGGDKLIIYFDADTINQYSHEIIYLKNGVVDTLKMHIAPEASMYTHYDSVWYNGRFFPGADSVIAVVK